MGGLVAGENFYSTTRGRVGRGDARAVAVYGDVMLDEFVWGDVTRMSPETPTWSRQNAAGGVGKLRHGHRQRRRTRIINYRVRFSHKQSKCANRTTFQPVNRI